jgi:hypothetical protein
MLKPSRIFFFGLSLLTSSNLFAQDTNAPAKSGTFTIKKIETETRCSVWVAGHNKGLISRDDIRKASGLTIDDGCGELKLIGYDASFVLPANKDTSETKTYHSRNANFTGPMRRIFKTKINYSITFDNIIAVSSNGDTVKLNPITLRVILKTTTRIGGVRFI